MQFLTSGSSCSWRRRPSGYRFPDIDSDRAELISIDFGILHRDLYGEPAGRVILVRAALFSVEEASRFSRESASK